MKSAISTLTVATVVTRLIAAAFFLLTAIYCLLVYLPFSYQQFILPNVLPGVSTFVRWHHFLFWGVLGAIAATSAEDLRNAATWRRTVTFLAAAALAGIYLTAWPMLPDLQSDRWSLAACLMWLTPVLWIAGLDVRSGGDLIAEGDNDEGEDRRIFDAAAGSAVCVSLTYFAIAGARATLGPVHTLVISLVWTVAVHLVVFGALFLALLAVRGVARLAGGSIVHEAFLMVVLAVVLSAFAFKQVVFAAISFNGPVATALAFAFALSVVGLVAGSVARLQRRSHWPVRSALELLAPFARSGASSSGPWRRRLVLAAIAAAAWFLLRLTATMDWNHLLQKLSAIAIWVVTFVALYALRGRIARPVARTAVMWLLLGAAVPAVTYRALDAIEGRVPAWLGVPRLKVRSILAGYAGRDPSFKTIYDVLSTTATGDERAFYDLLQRHTNIPREVRINPVEVNLVDALVPRSGPLPHIFIFVIDSLRPDYLAPYNRGVTFTPAIDAFARDSVVFKRAVTQYGATGLSEPSIWVGGLLVHQQYVLPFAPMNALDKLLATDGYQRFISRDSILRTIMPAGELDVELDAGVPNMQYDLCRSLTELQARVVEPSRRQRPIFAYTQPQNIHVSRLAHEGSRVPADASYSGFYPPYAARIKAMDACFGEFVGFLRDQGLYDDSLIVLTSDHGDSLGEGGRWGHAYTIFPEIIRIPLVVHLPRALQDEMTCDTDAVASLVDITPTLYYLLGHRPVVSGTIFGRPLCTATPAERIATRRDWYMVASSYGPVYGILRGNGRWLYIADGVNYMDYYYDLGADPAGAENLVTAAVRREYQPLIRAGLDEVNRFYRAGRDIAP